MGTKLLKIAIAGNIASGKSYALSKLSKYFKTFDCDKIVDRIYGKPKIKKLLKKKFGTVDKKIIAGIVFKNPKKRKQLEAIIWPLVKKEIAAIFRRFDFSKKQPEKPNAIIVEVPLLFEAKMQDLFDLVIFVDCNKSNQIKRLLKKGFSRKEVLERIVSQKPAKEKAKKADIVIENNHSLKQLDKKIDSLIDIIGRICFLANY